MIILPQARIELLIDNLDYWLLFDVTMYSVTRLQNWALGSLEYWALSQLLTELSIGMLRLMELLYQLKPPDRYYISPAPRSLYLPIL